MVYLFRKAANLKRLFSDFYDSPRFLCSSQVETMKYLNVAEKNDAAKNIAQHLSRGTSRRREGLSKYNKIYEFEAEVMGTKCQMVMTSVSGHLLALEFVGSYKNWQACNPLALLDAPVFKYCPENYDKIKKTLEREVRGCQGLIIWTDCDREGENIGFEIIEVCKAVKNNLRIFRAKFSEITFVSVKRALDNLEQPNKNISDAVDVRQELDLRIGAAFTRFQTLRLQKVFPRNLAEKLVSYGSCQFPTLGFVVERYRAVNSFISEPFWKIKVNHTMNNLSVDFNWERVRLFDQLACQLLHDICIENPQAKVCDVKTKPKSKWRPLPLDTVELEKLASRKLKINAKETMRLAEKLYTQGFISYPRTETNEFPKEMNLTQLVGNQTADPSWGAFAQNILDTGGPTPRQGNKSDKAHPPIHPTKYTNSLSGNEKRLYEFIVRSFLACCSKDAQGQETTVSIDVASEKFSASGLMITARNYLEVYPYDKWSSKEIHLYENGQTFNPTSIDMLDGNTSPPKLLTEADLIALMEKHGIGTDATHAEHIETIKSRSYVQLTDNIYFKPEPLGMGLVEGYDAMGLAISKPHLRAQLEADLKAISEGRKQPQQVLAEQIAQYKEVYETLAIEANKIDAALAERFSEQPNEFVANDEIVPNNMPPALKCPKCGNDMVMRRKKNNTDEFYISCMSYPNCKNAVWLPPSIVKTVQVIPDTCPVCGPNYKKLIFEWKANTISHLYPSPCTICIGGCDTTILDMLNINLSNVRTLSDNRTQNNLNGNNPRDNSVAVLPARQTRTNPPQSNVNRVSNTTNPARNNPFQSANVNRVANATNLARNNAPQPIFVPPSTVNRTNEARNPSQPIFIPPTANRVASATNQARNSGGNNVDNSDGNNVICNCNQPAVLLTVRKQNANHGRKFYKCPAGPNGGCDFFLWAPESTESTVNNPYDTPATSSWSNSDSNNSTRGWGTTVPSHTTNNGISNDGDVMCNCGIPCKKITVHKEGPNKGRLFYACAKDMSSRCNFFQWDDAEPTSDWGSTTSTSYRGTRGRGRSRGSGSTRNCSRCKQPGHTRNRCPNAHE